MWSGKGKTAIVGIGYSDITRRPQKPLGLLAIDACRAAIADSGLTPVGSMVSQPILRCLLRGLATVTARTSSA